MYQSRMPSGRVTRHSYKGRALSPIQRPGILVGAAQKIGTISRLASTDSVWDRAAGTSGSGPAVKLTENALSAELLEWGSERIIGQPEGIGDR
jgi:hypothetical protein